MSERFYKHVSSDACYLWEKGRERDIEGKFGIDFPYVKEYVIASVLSFHASRQERSRRSIDDRFNYICINATFRIDCFTHTCAFSRLRARIVISHFVCARSEVINIYSFRPRWRTQVVCLALTFLIVGFLFILRGWFGILSILKAPKVDQFAEEQTDNAAIAAWLRRARMYAESAKENQNTDRNTSVGASEQYHRNATGWESFQSKLSSNKSLFYMKASVLHLVRSSYATTQYRGTWTRRGSSVRRTLTLIFVRILSWVLRAWWTAPSTSVTMRGCTSK